MKEPKKYPTNIFICSKCNRTQHAHESASVWCRCGRRMKHVFQLLLPGIEVDIDVTHS